MKSIIQFIHPGGEHTKKSGTKWNTGIHKRKYLKIKGTYLEPRSLKTIEDIVYFWGEWEAQSHITPILGDIKGNNPRLIFEPYYKLPIGKVNTDPFVFGNQFYYCICKQGHYSTLRKLEIGDMILFGSNLSKYFVLDTVFVIKDWKEYKISEIIKFKSKYNLTFYDVSLAQMIDESKVDCKEIIEDIKCSGICVPSIGDDEDDSKPTKIKDKYRIYLAVMYNDKENFNDIFSFSPCLPDPVGNIGFERPVINNSIISQRLNQGIKIIRSENTEKVWTEIYDKVIKQGLNLMIKTELPNRIK